VAPAANGNASANSPRSTTTPEPSQRFVGNLEARERIEIAAKSTGILSDISVNEGDDVEKGAILFRQQDTQARLTMEQANAAVAQAEVQLAHTEREYERARGLAERGAAAQAKLDLALYGRDAAKAALRQAQTSRDLAKHYVNEAVSRAPIAGTITHRLHDPGELATMMPPTIVLILQDISVMKAKIKIPVNVLSRIKTGDHLDIWISDLGLKRDGVLARVADVVDPMTRTVELEVHVENADRMLKPGMFVEATIHGGAAAIVAPKPENPADAAALSPTAALATAKEKP
jgi:RND family efflux transporter MFP subunit